MLNSFYMNGIKWDVYYVHPLDSLLIDRTGSRTLATTDGRTKNVYLSYELTGYELRKVFIHELGHCLMISYGLLEEIHKMVKPQYRFYAEEWICNLFADYGEMIFDICYETIGTCAIHVVPYELEKIVS